MRWNVIYNLNFFFWQNYNLSLNLDICNHNYYLNPSKNNNFLDFVHLYVMIVQDIYDKHLYAEFNYTLYCCSKVDIYFYLFNSITLTTLSLYTKQFFYHYTEQILIRLCYAAYIITILFKTFMIVLFGEINYWCTIFRGKSP